MRVIITPRAKRELKNITKYIAKKSFQNAIKTANNIQLFINKLEKSPYLGRYNLELSKSIYIHSIFDSRRNLIMFYKFYNKNNF